MEWRGIRLPSQLPAAGAAPGIYTMPLSLASAMENGDPFATCILSWDAARAAGNYCGWSCELGNGEWRMMRCTCCQGCGSCTIFICQLGEGQWAMEPMDGATIPGKIYSKLWGKVVAIIKFLPPCKLWLKFHDFWKGDRTILLLRITLSSNQTEIPAEMP